MKFVFLILHYKNSDVTIQCVESMMKTFEIGSYEIVVVDNASGNGSYEELQEYFGGKEFIHFLHNEQNLGYAAGNNVGFRFAKRELNADFICLANNDVIFEDSDWINKVTAFYRDISYYVLGPDIVTPQGEHQNPFKSHTASRANVFKSLIHDMIVYWALKLKLQRNINNNVKSKRTLARDDWEHTDENMKGVLHGSCLVFSPDYVREFEGLYGGTFLYCEEEILCYILKKLNYRYVYYSNVQVIHCHSTSFKRSVQDEVERKKIIVKHRMKSYQKFLRITFCKGDLKKFLMERG